MAADMRGSRTLILRVELVCFSDWGMQCGWIKEEKWSDVQVSNLGVLVAS